MTHDTFTFHTDHNVRVEFQKHHAYDAYFLQTVDLRGRPITPAFCAGDLAQFGERCIQLALDMAEMKERNKYGAIRKSEHARTIATELDRESNVIAFSSGAGACQVHEFEGDAA